MEQYRDPLAEMTDADVRLAHTDQPMFPIEAHTENPARRFRYDDYEWEGFKVEGQVTLRLTKGYFTFVDEEDMEKIGDRSVCAHVDLCPGGNRIRKVRAVLEVDGKTTYLHRFLMSARKGQIVDHVNNRPLDNRSKKNLWIVNSSLNNSNRFYKTQQLSRGVKPEGKRFRGQISYEGKRYFSKMLDTAQEARDWYIAKYDGFYGKVLSSVEKPTRNLPVFPPTKPEFSFADTF